MGFGAESFLTCVKNTLFDKKCLVNEKKVVLLQTI